MATITDEIIFQRKIYFGRAFITISKNGVKMVVGKGLGVTFSRSTNTFWIYQAFSLMVHILLQKGVVNRWPKKSKTTNTLIVTDSQGIPLACSEPIAGNHNDAFNRVKTFDKMIHFVQLAEIPVDGLFLNADAGFDTTGSKTLNNF